MCTQTAAPTLQGAPLRAAGWCGLGVAIGALTVWGLGSAWLERERTALRHWADSTGVAYARDTAAVAAHRRAQDRVVAALLAQQDSAAERVARDSAQALAAARTASEARTARDAALALASLTAQQFAAIQTADSAADAQVAALEAEVGSLRMARDLAIERAAALTVSVTLADSGRGLAERRVTELETALRDRLRPAAPRKLWGIPLPRCAAGPTLSTRGPAWVGLTCGIPIG